MTDSYYQGALKQYASKLGLGLIALITALLVTLSLSTGVFTASAISPTGDVQFTQNELDTNWEADRQFPSDDATSVNAFGRADVARIGVDSSETQPGIFQRTEGIKTVGVQNFGDVVQVDLYVDPDWQDTVTRAGVWVVGVNGAGARDNLFGILEFVNNESCDPLDCSNQANITDHEGWRIWDSTIGWTNVNVNAVYGEWTTLTIELDADAQQYNYYVNDVLVGNAVGGENFIGEVFLNSYNYGKDTFPTLSNDSYAAHWHGGLVDPTTKEECKNGGWQAFGFKNQGQCVSSVASNKNNQ